MNEVVIHCPYCNQIIDKVRQEEELPVKKYCPECKKDFVVEKKVEIKYYVENK